MHSTCEDTHNTHRYTVYIQYIMQVQYIKNSWRPWNPKIEDLQENKDKLGRIKPPLLHINLNCVIPDELHLLLWITDRLIRNLILAAVVKDHPAKPLTGQMVRSLIEQIRDCGVHFEVYDKNQYEFTSLNGNDRKKLLQLLPPKLTNRSCQPPEFSDKVKKLWEVHRTILYSYI